MRRVRRRETVSQRFDISGKRPPPQQVPPGPSGLEDFMQKRTPAARARIWRPPDPIKANFGWLAFVIGPALIGGFVVEQTLAQDQTS